MGTFAKVVDGVVEQVIVVLDEIVGSYPESEEKGRQFIESLGLSGFWLQTSDTGEFRKQLAGHDYIYDETADEFVRPQPFPSWSLDPNNDWQPPTPKPTDAFYNWDEESLSWIAIHTTHASPFSHYWQQKNIDDSGEIEE